MTENDLNILAARFVRGYGLVETPLDDCIAALTTAHGNQRLAGGADRYGLHRRVSEPVAAIKFLLPLTQPAIRLVLFTTASKWTAVITNSLNGSDFADYGYALARRLATTAVRVSNHPGRVWARGTQREVIDYEARIFERHGADGREDKVIICMDDGGRWTFSSSEPLLEIERTFDYSARPKRDRFTSENLKSLLQFLGMPLVSTQTFIAARQYALIQEPYEALITAMPEEADNPAFGYFQRGLNYTRFMATHAASVIHDFERAVTIDPSYELKVRPYLIEARRILNEQSDPQL